MSISTTILSDEQVEQIADKYGITPWTKKGAPRYYLNLEELADIIGLEQSFYKSGYCSGCEYVGLDGERVSVAHARAYGDGGYMGSKTYICGGKVYCTWEPYGEDIAELIAARLLEIIGIDPDEGEVEEKWAAIPDEDDYYTYYGATRHEVEEKLAEAMSKWPERTYSIHRVRVGGRTGRQAIID